jgi:hypothetical protein
MNRKIIYISFVRLTEKYARDWYLDYCVEKKKVVEFWDIVSLVREEHEEFNSLTPGYLRYIQTYKEFNTLIVAPENVTAVYVMLISYSIRFAKPFRLLSKNNCKMVFISWGAMPAVINTESYYSKIITLFLLYPLTFWKRTIDIMLCTALRKFNLINKFDIVFAAGNKLISVNQHAKKIVPFNYCDFDHYKRIKIRNERFIQGKYAVFLDANAPYHSDAGMLGLKLVNAKQYYKSLNQFFALIERIYNFEVVIALHPKADSKNNNFEKRKTFIMKTAECVKDAELVILHNSTALGYAVLNLKPLMFIYTDEMLALYEKTVIAPMNGFAAYFNCETYNVDHITDGRQVKIRQPDIKAYSEYKYNYLTSHASEDFMSEEIFIKEINAL